MTLQGRTEGVEVRFVVRYGAILLISVALIPVLTVTVWGQTVTATVGVGTRPFALAVNSVTNKVYVVNYDDNCAQRGATSSSCGGEPRD